MAHVARNWGKPEGSGDEFEIQRCIGIQPGSLSQHSLLKIIRLCSVKKYAQARQLAR